MTKQRKRLIKEIAEKVQSCKRRLASKANAKVQTTPIESTAVSFFGTGNTARISREKALDNSDGLNISKWTRKELADKEVLLLDELIEEKTIGNKVVTFRKVALLNESPKPISVPVSWLQLA